jgi:hypothetical protein
MCGTLFLSAYTKRFEKVHFTSLNNSLCLFDPLNKIITLFTPLNNSRKCNIAPIEVCFICFVDIEVEFESQFLHDNRWHNSRS